MSELIERLEHLAATYAGPLSARACRDAISRLQALEAENERLRGAVSSAERRVSPSGRTEAQRALDLVWRQIDALGGTHTPQDRASGFADTYDAALNAACAAVEALGGRPS